MIEPTRIIDGKKVADDIRRAVAQQVLALQNSRGITPQLAVVIVGDDPASEIYVKSKIAKTREAGMKSRKITLPGDADQHELLETIQQLNCDDEVHGILVQLPLPDHIDIQLVVSAIDPRKDVDGFHIENFGKLMVGGNGHIPCTPKGILRLLKAEMPEMAGLHALVVGSSNIVGKPMAALLLKEECTVTVAHIKTQNLAEECRRADILVVATGNPFLVRGEWIKPGAIVIDVGINRIAHTDGVSKVVGDVRTDEALGIARAITPVPGGVGPMTIACLLENTVEAAKCSITPQAA